MPMLLKRDVVRLFEASVEALYLALAGLGIPRRNTLREESAQYALHAGLIGAAAELAMGACLIQTFGRDYIILSSGRFKSGKEIVDDFRRLLKNPVPRSLFLPKELIGQMSIGRSCTIAPVSSNYWLLCGQPVFTLVRVQPGMYVLPLPEMLLTF